MIKILTEDLIFGYHTDVNKKEEVLNMIYNSNTYNTHILLDNIDNIYDSKITSIKFLEKYINLEYMNKNFGILDSILGFRSQNSKIKCFFKIDSNWDYTRLSDKIIVSVKKNSTINEFIKYFKSINTSFVDGERYPLLWAEFVI